MADDEKKPFHNPFAALSHLRGNLPATKEEAGSSDAAEKPRDQPGLKTRPQSARPPSPKSQPTVVTSASGTIPRAVLRYERSGRGGKEVTLVEQLELKPAEREQWLKALKSSLGCGGYVEGDALVIQGDQRKRLPQLLIARGVKKVTIG